MTVLTKIIHNETLMWVLLVAATLLTWLLIEESLTDVAIYTVIVLSSVKVYLIGVSYMEIYQANAFFRRFYHVWVLGVCVMVALFKYLAF